MAEAEEVVAAPPLSDLKRKHEDLEPEAPEPPPKAEENENAKAATENESESVKKSELELEVDESETKRPRLDAEEMPDGLVTENGIQEEEEEEDPEEEEEKEAEQPSMGDKSEKEDAQQPAEKAVETVNTEEQLPTDDNQTKDIQPPSVEKPQLESADEQPSGGGEFKESSAEVAYQGDDYSAEQQPASESQTMSRKMEVPNNKVGVLIGKAGETIRLLQSNSGAKIQITRDSEADPYSTTRLVELIGTLDNINKAEKLIKDVIAEAELGGSPSLVARGFNTLQAAGADEQILIQVPHDKVGVIIGKGGETIKNLQTRSGARIQLIPQHLPEGDQSKDRTVRVTGDKKQIEMAREMIKDAMNQPVRPSRFSGGYNQQVFRPRGPAASQQWGPRGARPVQPAGYDYQQRGPHPSQNSHYPNQAYGNYPPQQVASGGSSFGPAWEQRPPSTMQGPPAHSGGYDYYGRQSHMVDAPRSVPQSNPVSAHGSGPSPASMGPPPSHGNYNYGQPHGSEYGQPAPYSQAAPPQSYGQNQVPYGASQPGGYPQGTHPGYAPQDQYGKPQSYGMQPQGPPSQQYSQPRASQPGDVPYQGPISSVQPYGQNAAPQQTYPYVSSGPMQQTYPAYGSAPTTDGYNQLQPATGPAPVYPQQGGQPASGYVQPGGQQQALGYAQAGPTGGYASYPSAQPGYTEQPTQNNAGYGYQGAADPAYASAPGSAYVAPATAQAGYAQPAAPTQAGYGYPQYDSTQMYGAQR